MKLKSALAAFIEVKTSIAALLATALVALALASPASALIVDPNKIQPERDCSADNSVCSIRATMNYNDPNVTGGVWWATLPKNAYVLAVDFYVSTAFNAGTTNNMTIGVTKTGADFLAATSVGSTGVTHATSAAGLATQATSVAGNQTAVNGAVPVYIRYVTSGTAATAGVVTVVITFVQNNDK